MSYDDYKLESPINDLWDTGETEEERQEREFDEEESEFDNYEIIEETNNI